MRLVAKTAYATALLVALAVTLFAFPLSIPYVFTDGEPLSATTMNANFAAVQTAVNSKQDLLGTACGAGQVVTGFVAGSPTCTTATTVSGVGDITGISTAAPITGGVAAGTASLGIATGGITSTHIADGTVTGTDIANSSVTGTDIADGSIVAADLAADSVNSAKTSDEPGLDFSQVTGSVALPTDTSVIVLRSVALTPPAAGYAVASCSGQYSVSSQNSLMARTSIAVNTTGVTPTSHGFDGDRQHYVTVAGLFQGSVHSQYAFAVSGGVTYSIYCLGNLNLVDAGETGYVWNPGLVAMYFRTAY